MTSVSSKAIPFLVLAIATGLLAVDVFTDFEIDETHIQLVGVILTPLGLGGLVNKGWNTFKQIKVAKYGGDK